MDPVVQMTFMIAGLLLLGAFGEYIFSRTGIPDMVWLVAAGIVAGPVFKIITPEILTPALPFFGAIALIVILLGGGMAFRIGDVAAAAPRALVLALVGFILSVVATCLYGLVMTKIGMSRAHPLAAWIMAGAIIGGTSSLVIIPTMAGGKVDKRVARLLEVESCITDALCVVVALVMVEIVLQGSVDTMAPIVALARAGGFGLIMGMVGGALYLPIMPLVKGKGHAYTILVAWFLGIYGVTQQAGGNGALSILAAALLIGNASDLLPKIYQNVDASSFSTDETARVIHSQLTFSVKSFFFFLIGLLFPTDPRLIIFGALLAVVQAIFRLPAVRLSLWGAGFTVQQKKLVAIAIPRGLAAGVLSTVPLYRGVPNSHNLAPVVFSMIVFSIILFAGGFALFNRREEKGSSSKP